MAIDFGPFPKSNGALRNRRVWFLLRPMRVFRSTDRKCVLRQTFLDTEAFGLRVAHPNLCSEATDRDFGKLR